MNEARLGLCGFTIGAAQYYRRFNVLEVQQTFYDPPAPETLRRWRDAAPPDFEFTMKAWQVITHLGTSRTYRRLKSPFSDTARAEAGGFRLNDTTRSAYRVTLEARELLRATAILFQCPPSFRPTDANASAMREFFAAADRPEGVRYLWEPRGKWPDELIADLCRDCRLIHAVDPFIRPSVTPELTYWRLHGNGSHYAAYKDEELDRLIDWLPASTTYVMFNNIPRVKDSARFREHATARGVAIA
ncbi:MAG TPA: DUF72 domain-containing protein [Gemmatimonadaceae bacterium]|nr:DUF72 domain-containing protein [Gemmatimonadaceae bacterium]